MQCSRCLFINGHGSGFCNKCGAPLSLPMPQQAAPQIQIPKVVWILLGIFAAIVVIVAIAQSGKPPVIKPTTSPSVAQPAETIATDTPAEHLKTAKHFYESDHGLGSLYAARSELTKIQPSAAEYKEAQGILKTIEPEIAKEEKKREAADKQRAAAEAPALRERLADDYVATVSAANPHLNFIKKKLVKTKGGYALWATHQFFSNYTFAVGNDAQIVWGWINANRAELKSVQIVKVGVMGEGPYSSYAGYKVD
jgi:hypothetical protein